MTTTTTTNDHRPLVVVRSSLSWSSDRRGWVTIRSYIAGRRGGIRPVPEQLRRWVVPASASGTAGRSRRFSSSLLLNNTLSSPSSSGSSTRRRNAASLLFPIAAAAAAAMAVVGATATNGTIQGPWSQTKTWVSTLSSSSSSSIPMLLLFVFLGLSLSSLLLLSMFVRVFGGWGRHVRRHGIGCRRCSFMDTTK